MSVTAVDIDSVAELPVFSGLGTAELARILESASVERMPAGTMLFTEGDRPTALHVVISGTVEIFSNRSGRDWGVMLMNAGDVLTPGAVLFDEVYTTCAQTIGTCKILIIDAVNMRTYFAQDLVALRVAHSLAFGDLPGVFAQAHKGMVFGELLQFAFAVAV